MCHLFRDLPSTYLPTDLLLLPPAERISLGPLAEGGQVAVAVPPRPARREVGAAAGRPAASLCRVILGSLDRRRQRLRCVALRYVADREHHQDAR